MKLLARLAHGALDGCNLLRFRRSIGLRSIHLAPGSGNPRTTEPSDSPATTATAEDPRWVLLPCSDGKCRWNDSFVADAKTVAESRTSTGERLRVALDLAPPPATSVLCYDCAESAPAQKYFEHAVHVIAAHGDSVLLRMTRRRELSPPASRYDHFVYRAGSGARPPSMSLLPTLKFLKMYQGLGDPSCHPLLSQDTGILRRGHDKVLVARIEVLSEYQHNAGPSAMANLCVLRPGRSHWEENRLVPIAGEQDGQPISYLSDPEMAIPVGDHFLCWFGNRDGFLLCNMAEEGSPKLRHVPLPTLPYDGRYYTDDLEPLADAMNMGAAGPSAVKLVAIEPRCCCGGFGRSACLRSHYAFTVTTWTLTLTMDEPVNWVKDCVMDCEEIWALPGYEAIPRVHLQCPIVSLDNPDVVCFKVVSFEDQKVWMIQVDMRRKELMAVTRRSIDPWKTPSSDYLRHAKF